MEKQESNYNMIDWWKKVVFKNYANFSGRARRAEYWFFVLGNFLLIVPFYLLALVGFSNESIGLTSVGDVVYILSTLVLFIPGLAAAVRRLHDINKSGWYYFIVLIPLIGAIILLVWFFTDGDRYTNNYGQDPKNLNDVLFDFEKTGSTS